MTRILKLPLASAAAGILLYLWLGNGNSTSKPAITPPSSPTSYGTRLTSSQIARTWGNTVTLPDHFARHGRDFGAKDTDDYARMAYEFFQRAQREGFPAKIDSTGVYRVYEPRTGSFGAYNRDGTTKTFFKPGNSRYFERQPGQPINLKIRR